MVGCFTIPARMRPLGSVAWTVETVYQDGGARWQNRGLEASTTSPLAGGCSSQKFPYRMLVRVCVFASYLCRENPIGKSHCSDHFLHNRNLYTCKIAYLQPPQPGIQK